ncbi:MAG: imidazole glycerol phosphate synthase subunit HisH [Microscillaceae bacterium]|nr:imidazole glycerol phosphate synthase subunit HisH [Microscillaceae bacterium]MDW8460859.1 imidazole glycerol phosphate synthase subunit HisH [Cytophagales bacterium]
MKVAILQYNAGNVQSVRFALERLGVSPIVTYDQQTLISADKIIFPGVGEASTAMQFLKEKQLDKLIPTLKQPFLGICLGMQLMCKFSEEGKTTCLGIFEETVRLFDNSQNLACKVPHIGWNNLQKLKSPLFKGLSENCEVYFVHSYYVPLNSYTIAQTDYLVPFSAALHKKNFFATQFHPEKSATVGEKILQNFLEL